MMNCRSWSIVGIIVVAAMAISAIDATPVLAKRPGNRVPVEYRQLYNALEADLDDFEATIDSSWDGSTYPVKFSAALSNANSNIGEALLDTANRANILTLLDVLQGLGVTGISLDINFPLFDSDFTTDWERYKEFYIDVVAQARSRGMEVNIESTTIFPNFSPLPVEPYYATLDFETYKLKRLEMLTIIAEKLQPDRLTIGEEPDAEARNTGQPVDDITTYVGMLNFFLDGSEDPDGPVGLTELELTDIDGKPLNIQYGAGFGTWQKDYIGWATGFASVANLNFINIHVYPVDQDLPVGSLGLLDRAIPIADIAKDADKDVVMGEAWLYKWQWTEQIEGPIEVFARDTYSFFAPLDQKFLQVMVKFAHFKQLEYMSPFWTNYFIEYLNYNDVNLLDSSETLALALQAATDEVTLGTLGIENIVLTETATFYQSLISEDVISFDLSANGYKKKGLQKVDLTWNTSTNVDVLRNGDIIDRLVNESSYTDHIDLKGAGTYTYQVCDVVGVGEPEVCSNTVTVIF